MNYAYPLEDFWSIEETTQAIAFYNAVEQAYESSIDCEQFLTKYHAFSRIVPAITEQRRISRQFEEASGYSIYNAIHQAKKLKTGKLMIAG
ncbi:UPF0223 family protein [Holzapfeliella floricola]|nr:UPF0223 family protein [Holzapfeliella floricola]